MGNTPWFVDFVNIAVPWGEVLIGLGVLLDAMTRLAAFFGAFMMLLFYLGNWDVAHGYINGDFAYMLVFLSVAAFGAGRIFGLDRYIESYEIDGQPSSSGTRGLGISSGDPSRTANRRRRRPLSRLRPDAPRGEDSDATTRRVAGSPNVDAVAVSIDRCSPSPFSRQ